MGIVRSACIYEKALREAGFNDLTRKKLIHVDFKPQVAWIAKGHSYDLVAKQKRNIHKSSDYVDEMFPNQLIQSFQRASNETETESDEYVDPNLNLEEQKKEDLVEDKNVKRPRKEASPIDELAKAST